MEYNKCNLDQGKGKKWKKRKPNVSINLINVEFKVKSGGIIQPAPLPYLLVNLPAWPHITVQFQFWP